MNIVRIKNTETVFLWGFNLIKVHVSCKMHYTVKLFGNSSNTLFQTDENVQLYEKLWYIKLA